MPPYVEHKARGLLKIAFFVLLMCAGNSLRVKCTHIHAELGERVRRLSKAMSPLKLASKLLDGVKAGQVPAAGLVASAGEL